MKDKISIIVPFYNSAKTIERCIQSILNQTYQNYEVILVSDGGDDGSEEIVKKYLEKDSRLRLINKGHGGVSRARNLGLEVASGDYIEFLDSDDHWEPNILQRMIETSKKNDADIVVCAFKHPSLRNYLGNKVLDTTSKEGLMKYYQTTFAAVVPWNKLYKREVIKTLFDEEVSVCEDDLFNLANMFNTKKIVGIDDVLYHYYVAPRETSLDESSCINKLAKADEFWLTKETHWYKRRALLEKSKVILEKILPEEDANDFAYARMFDFMIWELLLLNSVGVDKDGLIYEIQEIFKEKDFIKSVTMREKYGLKYIIYNDQKLNELVKKYVQACIKIANDTEKYNLNIKPFYACLNLFVKLFISRNDKELNTSDIMANAYYELENNLTEEAKYVNNMEI